MKKLFTLLVIFTFFVSVLSVAQDNYQRKQDDIQNKIIPFETNLIKSKLPLIEQDQPTFNHNTNIIDASFMYAFTSATSTYTPITGGTVLATGTIDDNSYTALPIGFTFTYNGTAYTTFSVNSNGYIVLGSTISNSYSPISSLANAISAVGRDLQGNATGEIRYQLLGSSGSYSLVVQWLSYRKYYATGDDYNFQIKLNQTGNTIQFVYGTMTSNLTNANPQVGISGPSVYDFSNRTNASGWASSVAGTVNNATSSLVSGTIPASGLIYSWTPSAYVTSFIANITPNSSAIQTSAYLAATIPYWSFNAIAGTSYGFSLCSNTEDSYLRIYSASTVLANADDNGPYCSGVPGSMTWTCPTSGTYYVVASHYSYSNFTNAGNLAYCIASPVVTTTTATSITNSAATSGGNVTWGGGLTVTIRGVCWSTIANPTTANSKTVDGSGTGAYTSSITGLTAGTLYHYRAYATNSAGTTYGTDLTFTTASNGPPSVTTTTPSSITSTTASSGGNVTFDGGASVTARGVCWSTSANPTIANSLTVDGSGTGVYTSSITGLTANTLFHVRAYATNVNGTSYGSDLTFTTLCANSTIPLSQGFNATTIPGCWTSQLVSGTSAIQYVASSSYPTTTPQEGTHYVYWNSFSISSGNSTRLVSPPVTTTGKSSVDVKFYWMHDAGYPGNADGVYVEYSTNGTNWTTVGSMIPRYDATLTGWNQKIVTLPAGAGNQATVYVGFRFYSAYGNNCSMDNLTIQETPANPVFSITPTSKAFGNTTLGGGTVDQTFSITNTGGSTLTINSSDFTLTGSDPTQFQIIGTTTLNLTTGQTGSVRVQFTPTTLGAKTANLHIVDNIPSSHDIALTGTGVLNAPQSLIGGLTTSFKPSLTWQAPAPGAEIKIDDGTVEQNMWVGSPSTTNQLFFNKMVSPHNGTISQIGIYAYAGTANLFNSVMLCPDDGSGKPNLSSPYATFSNVVVGTSYSWIFLLLPSPQAVTAGQVFYIVTQWPSGSTTGPYIGADNTTSNGRSYWTQDGGTTWNAWAANWLMRAYMGTYSDKLVSGISNPVTKLIPVSSANDIKIKIEGLEFKKEEKPISVPASLIYGANGERVLSSYTVKRGTSTGIYTQNFTGISTLTYDDNSAVLGNTYYYVVDAVYTEGTSSHSNEVVVTALNPNYGIFSLNLAGDLYKFSNNTSNGNPGTNEKPNYEWIPTTDFTNITFADNDDGNTQISFPGQFFRFFGTDYSSVYVNVNGFLTFGTGATDWSPAGPLPQAGDPANMIAAAFMDLYVRTTYAPVTNISYKIFPDKIVINYENVYQVSAATGQNYISFQIILYASSVTPSTNSLYIINYNDDLTYTPLNTNLIVTGSSVGVNGPSGTYGFNYRYSGVKGPMFSGIADGPNALSLGYVDFNAPLPVTLSSFSATTKGRDVTLAWKTETEINNAGFDVERAEVRNQNSEFKKIGFIPGKGSSNSPVKYTFEDKKLSSGKYNYRLRQIDNNGNFEYHNLSSVMNVALPTKFNISQNYPNPFNPTTKIDFDLPFDSKVSIIIYDITGREIKTLVNDARTAGFHTVLFNASHLGGSSTLSSGTYFYRIMTKSKGGDYVMTKKMVLVK